MFELIVQSGPAVGQRYKVETRASLGRIKGNDIVLSDASVSRQHARVLVQGSQLLIRDLDSANGTFLNQRKIDQATAAPGDLLRIGTVELRVEAGAGTPDATPAPAAEASNPPASPGATASRPEAPEPPAPPSVDRIRTRTPSAASAAATAAGEASIRQRRKTLQYSPYARGSRDGGLLNTELEQRSALFKLGVAVGLIAVAVIVILFSIKLTDWLVPGPAPAAVENTLVDDQEPPLDREDAR